MKGKRLAKKRVLLSLAEQLNIGIKLLLILEHKILILEFKLIRDLLYQDTT